ncbi:MAG: DUF6635 family protein [Pseudomonadota bacterium]
MSDAPAQTQGEKHAPQQHLPSRQTQRSIVNSALDHGISKYIASRKAKVPIFVNTYFSFSGALRLHRKALGKDLYKAPLNIIWAIPSLVIRALSWVSKKFGAEKRHRALKRVPAGFQTDVQKEVNWLIYTELLELPYVQDDKVSEKDALLETILSDQDLAGIIGQYLTLIHSKSGDPTFRRTLTRNLEEYPTSRTAAADLAGNMLTLASGYVAFHQVTPGAIAGGSAAAAAIAQQIAISNFWLGSTLGSWYYGLFPAAASTGLMVAATASIMAALAIISTFTGIVTDPLQSKLGLHQKRLIRFLDALEGELRGSEGSEFQIKDRYAARVFDILDLLRLAVRSIG